MSIQRLLSAVALMTASAALGHAQTATPSCLVSAVPPLVRLEGVSERMGDIVFECMGAPQSQVAGTLSILLNAPVTNRLSGTNLDVIVTQKTTAGTAILPVSAKLQSTGQIVLENFRFQFDATGRSEIRITNVRADVSQSGNLLQNVNAQLALNPPGLLNFTENRLTIGVVNRGLFSTSLLRFVGSQIGSPVPTTLTFGTFLESGTAFSSTRLTEGFVSAFEKRGPNMDHGVRLLVRYTGLPADSRIFVPAAVAGSSALRPTSAGDFGGTISGGQYLPGSNTLLLVRVSGADQNGAGGFVPFAPSPGVPVALTDLQEVTVSNGTAVATYEVVDANPSVRETVQIPTFLGISRSEFPRSLTITRQVSFGPISTAPSVSPFAPIPRFVQMNPPSDCDILQDCNQYRAKLVVNSALLDWEVPQGLPYVRREVIFSNEGGGPMPWAARVEYKTGSGWVEIYPAFGFEPVALGVAVILTNLQPGLHEATLVIDAGEAGTARIPIRLKLNPRAEPPPPLPTISGTGNAATFAGPLVPGSLATIRGANLGGANVSVTLNGTPARVIYTGADQINLEVPAGLAGTTAQLVVSAGGVSSAPATVNLAPVSPGIFVPGILNQNNTVNSAANPAPAGSYLQIYATGVLTPSNSGQVEVVLNGQTLAPAYAGPAPGISAVQQVNVQVPSGLQTMATDIAICTTVSGQRVCSPKVALSILGGQ